jgi:predicted neuraminidase
VVRKRTSSDNGHSWSPVETLFAGSRTFVRQPLVVLDNGDWLLPVFNCPSAPGRRWNRDDDTSSVKISSDGGLTWRDIEVPGSNGCVHMNKAQLADGSLLALPIIRATAATANCPILRLNRVPTQRCTSRSPTIGK